jgi:hypothetical protein
LEEYIASIIRVEEEAVLSAPYFCWLLAWLALSPKRPRQYILNGGGMLHRIAEDCILHTGCFENLIQQTS